MDSSSTHQLDPEPGAHRAGLIVIAPSPQAAAWRQLIREQAERDGVPVLAVDPAETGDQGRLSIHLSDNLADLTLTSHDEITVILTHAETFGHWVGSDRTQASLVLSALPMTKEGVRYITPAVVAGARRIDVLSFLSLDVQEMASDASGAHRDQALSLYREGPPQPGSSYVWAPEIFVIDSKPERPSAGDAEIDLAGRARCLVHGPYVVLPKGKWKASARFAVDTHASRHRFKFEWGSPDDFTSFEISPGKPGHFRVDLTHAFAEALLSELRIILPDSSLAGALTFEGVDLQMQGEAG